MATHTITTNPQVITVSGTSNNTIDLSKAIGPSGEVLIEWISGTTIQFNTLGACVSTSGAINSTQTKLVLPVQAHDLLNCKGGAGGETFQITCI